MDTRRLLKARLMALASVVAGTTPELRVAGRPIRKKKKVNPEIRFIKKKFSKLNKLKNPATGREVSLWSFRIKPAKKTWKKLDPKRRKVWFKMHEKHKKLYKKFRDDFRKKLHKIQPRKHGPAASKLSPMLLKRHDFIEKSYGKESFDLGDGKGKRPFAEIAKEMQGKAKENKDEIAKLEGQLSDMDREDKDGRKEMQAKIDELSGATGYKNLMQKANAKHGRDRRKLIRKYGNEEFDVGDRRGPQPLKKIVERAVRRGDKKTFQTVMKMVQKKEHADYQEEVAEKAVGWKVEKIKRHLNTVNLLLKDKVKTKKWTKKIDEARSDPEKPVAKLFSLIQEIREEMKGKKSTTPTPEQAKPKRTPKKAPGKAFPGDDETTPVKEKRKPKRAPGAAFPGDDEAAPVPAPAPAPAKPKRTPKKAPGKAFPGDEAAPAPAKPKRKPKKAPGAAFPGDEAPEEEKPAPAPAKPKRTKKRKKVEREEAEEISF